MAQRNTKKTTEEFIADARKVHGDEFIYDDTEYKNNKTKVCITCRKHGKFWQTPSNHLSGYGCLMCAVEKANEVRRSNLEEAIAKARETHGDKYDYSEAEYVNNNTKTCMICPEHGKFYQSFRDHLRGHGCPKCGRIKAAKNTMDDGEEIIKKINEIHKGKYILDKFVYNGYHTKSIVTCPIHGDFEMTPANLLRKIKPQGCPMCRQSRTEAEIQYLLEDNNIAYNSQQTFDWLKYKYNLKFSIIFCNFT